MSDVKVPPPRDTTPQDTDEFSFLYCMKPFKNISELERDLRTLILLKCNPTYRQDIKIMSKEINESLEDKIVQSVFEICNFVADPEILEKYNMQLRVARRNGWSGRGLGHY